MRNLIDTSGDAQILQMMEFASSAFRASGLVFYWVNDNAEMFGFQGRGVPDDFIDRYRTDMGRFDPLLVRRLARAKRRIAWLQEEAPPVPSAPAYLEFLGAYDIIDNLEFVFWDNNEPFAGLGVLRNRNDPPLQAIGLDLAAIHKYFEFNMLMHPRQREARMQATLARRFGLTRREIEAVSLLCAGASNHDIAESMGVRLATVKTHIVNVLDKLGVGNRSSVIGLTLALQ
jgi:DNA-binding CsgD family transcriptional regulator